MHNLEKQYCVSVPQVTKAETDAECLLCECVHCGPHNGPLVCALYSRQCLAQAGSPPVDRVVYLSVCCSWDGAAGLGRGAVLSRPQGPRPLQRVPLRGAGRVEWGPLGSRLSLCQVSGSPYKVMYGGTCLFNCCGCRTIQCMVYTWGLTGPNKTVHECISANFGFKFQIRLYPSSSCTLYKSSHKSKQSPGFISAMCRVPHSLFFQ